MEEVASLHLVKRDDHILEEDDVLFSQGDCEARDDASQDIEKFRGAVELECLVDERVETVVYCFSDHFSPWDQLGVESVVDVLEVLPLPRFFGVEELEELLDEGRSDVYLKGLHISTIIDDELEEELVDGLQVEPGWVGKCLFLHENKVTSSIPTPSPGRPCFLRTGSGLKMFFSIMLMTRSR